MTTSELHALRAVVRHWHDQLVAEAQRPIDDMREWTDTDWADSGWTPAEADAIRRALTEDTPGTPTGWTSLDDVIDELGLTQAEIDAAYDRLTAAQDDYRDALTAADCTEDTPDAD